MTTAHIAEPLRTYAVPIDSLTPWPGNPRQGDIEAMAQSLRTNGQYRLAVVQESTGQICAGNHMWLAARDELGWDTIAAITLPLTDEEAKRILAADNGVAEKGSFNEHLLASLLSDLATTELGLAGTGYEPADLEDLANLLAAPESLSDLASQHGTWDDDTPHGDSGDSPVTTTQGWPVITITCPPDVKARFDHLFNSQDGEPWQRLAALLDFAEQAQ